MPSNTRNIKILAAFAMLLMLAFGAGCTGFFVNPTLTSVTIGPPTPTIQQGNTLQMTATGTYNDGTTKTLSSNLFWSSATPTVASISTSGLVTGISVGTAQLSAASGTVTGTTTLTVSLGNITRIAVSPTNSSTLQGTTVQFTAIATTSDGMTHDITSSAQWNSSNSNAGTINSSGLFTAAPSVGSAQTTTISATSGNITGQTGLTVNP
ncbi:MAG: Ig-like domain-containing protein [Acidobacteriota bacterium]|nr:Ig-like domain-containing protein [Acidobacteriota bacterium]